MKKDVMRKYNIDTPSELRIKFEQNFREINRYLDTVVEKHGYKGLKKIKNSLKESLVVGIPDNVWRDAHTTKSSFNNDKERTAFWLKWCKSKGFVPDEKTNLLRDVASGDLYRINQKTHDIVKADIKKESEDLDEKQRKIKCKNCEEISPETDWKKNHGGCPNCDSKNGTAVKEDLDEAIEENDLSESAMAEGNIVEVIADEIEVETLKGRDAELYRGEMFKVIKLKNKYAELKSVKPDGSPWSDNNKAEYIVTSDKFGSFKKK